MVSGENSFNIVCSENLTLCVLLTRNQLKHDGAYEIMKNSQLVKRKAEMFVTM